MKMCLFNFIFTLGRYKVVVKKSCDNVYVDNKNNNVIVMNNEINYYLDFPKNFSAKDFDLFFTICYYAKKAKNKEKMIFIDYDEMSRFLDYNKSNKNKKRFFDEIYNCCVRCSLITSLFSNKTDNFYSIEPKHFFKSISSDRDGEKVLFQLNEVAFDYLYVFENFFGLDLKEFCSLKSKGAKILIRLLIQYKNNKIDKKTGLKSITFDVENFRKILKSNAIESNEPKYISSKVLNPAVKELAKDKQLFNYIDYELLKTRKDIVGYKISFDDSNRL